MVEMIQNHSYNSAPMRSEIVQLEQKFQEVKDEQGFFGSLWNGFKELTNLGQSESDCENKLEAFQKGEVSFEEALDYINDYQTKQKDMSNLGTNILTGVGAIGAAIVTGGTSVALSTAIAVGMPTGAALKTGLNIFDRATNDIDDDALDLKQIAKDAVSGAVTGATSAVTSGVGAGIKAGKIGLSIANGVKCGATCGAVSGATGYMSDVVFDNREFKFGDLTKNTLTSSFISGTVGAIVGSGMYGVANLQGNVGKNIVKSTTEAIVSDSTSSSTRKILGQVERSIIAA